MTTFALVHGGWGGAWCWERLGPELETREHRVVAMDLPCDDPEATFDTYADVVAEAVAGEEDVVLVAHSLGGHTAPLVAARRPVARIVYLCALLPLPGASLVDQFAADTEMLDPGYRDGVEADDAGRTTWVDEATACRHLFADCDPGDARRAFRRLRPQASSPYVRPCSLDALPAVPSTYVVGTDDRMVNPAWSRRTAPARLGVEPVELPGGHSPFLARPAELAALLDGLAT